MLVLSPFFLQTSLSSQRSSQSFEHLDLTLRIYNFYLLFKYKGQFNINGILPYVQFFSLLIFHLLEIFLLGVISDVYTSAFGLLLFFSVNVPEFSYFLNTNFYCFCFLFKKNFIFQKKIIWLNQILVAHGIFSCSNCNLVPQPGISHLPGTPALGM